ncbi:hypothetical protein FVT88_21345 [Salmonella enterica]|nr:hypothetical protein [Salmonella enterica]
MINITFSMILYVWFYYHILCMFYAAQIRKIPVPDLSSLPRLEAATKHKMCHTVSCLFSYMLC